MSYILGAHGASDMTGWGLAQEKEVSRFPMRVRIGLQAQYHDDIFTVSIEAPESPYSFGYLSMQLSFLLP